MEWVVNKYCVCVLSHENDFLSQSNWHWRWIYAINVIICVNQLPFTSIPSPWCFLHLPLFHWLKVPIGRQTFHHFMWGCEWVSVLFRSCLSTCCIVSFYYMCGNAISGSGSWHTYRRVSDQSQYMYGEFWINICMGYYQNMFILWTFFSFPIQPIWFYNLTSSDGNLFLKWN